MKIEIISTDEIVAVKRGRKGKVDHELVNALKNLPKGKAVRLPDLKVDHKLPKDKFTSAKSSVGASIRSAGKSAGVKVSVQWSPDGVPQVTTN